MDKLCNEVQSPFENNTQIEPTQQEQDDIYLDDISSGSRNVQPKVWCRLVSMSAHVPTQELYVSLPPDESGRFNIYQLGRSSKCDMMLNHQKISHVHCMLYCKYRFEQNDSNAFDAFIEDSSANGTYIINHNIRLKKGELFHLNSGDQICLLNPITNQSGKSSLVHTEKDDALDSDLQKASFIVQILPQSDNIRPPIIKKDRFQSNNSSATNAVEDARGVPKAFYSYEHSGEMTGLTKSNSIMDMISHPRDIGNFYHFDKKLGMGTSGQVYQVVHKDTGCEYAAKVIETRALGKPRAGEDLASLLPRELLREAEIVRSLRHPGIVSLADVFVAKNKLYLVMDLLRGGDLFDRIVSKQKYSEQEAAVVMFQLLSTISYLHRNGVAHRDLKPENILLVSQTSDVHVKITDFGLAKQLSEGGGLKTYCGTPQYLAPEVQRQRDNNKRTYSVEADMWSLGVILFVMLSGTLPWDDKNMEQQIENGKYKMDTYGWRGVSEAAKDLVRRMLVVNPRHRCSAVDALAHPWLLHLAAPTAHTPPVPAPLPPHPSPESYTTPEAAGVPRSVAKMEISTTLHKVIPEKPPTNPVAVGGYTPVNDCGGCNSSRKSNGHTFADPSDPADDGSTMEISTTMGPQDEAVESCVEMNEDSQPLHANTNTHTDITGVGVHPVVSTTPSPSPAVVEAMPSPTRPTRAAKRAMKASPGAGAGVGGVQPLIVAFFEQTSVADPVQHIVGERPSKKKKTGR